MFVTFCLIWPLICALANRVRGGWLAYEILKVFPYWDTTWSRIFISTTLTLPLYIAQLSFHVFMFQILLFVGFLWAWSPWVGMGEPYKDTIELTKRGLILTFPPGIFLEKYYFAFSGLLMGLCYLTALYFPIKHKESDGNIWSTTETGELYFGALLGFFIVISIFF